MGGSYSGVSHWVYDSGQSDTNNLQFELSRATSPPTFLNNVNLWGSGHSIEWRIADGQSGNAALHADHDPANNQYVYEFYYDGNPGGDPDLLIIFKNTTSNEHSQWSGASSWTGYQFVDHAAGSVQPTKVYQWQGGNVAANFDGTDQTNMITLPSFFTSYTPSPTANGIRFSKQSDGSTLLQVNVVILVHVEPSLLPKILPSPGHLSSYLPVSDG